MNDNIEVFDVAGKKIRLTPDEAALVIYADRKYRNDRVSIAKRVDGKEDYIAVLQFMERTFNGQTCCVVVVPRIPMEGKSTIDIRVRTGPTFANGGALLWQTMFAGQVMELDYREQDDQKQPEPQPVKEEAPTEAPAMLQVEMAGTTFALKENEAALVVYADPKYRGLNIYLEASGAMPGKHLTTQFTPRKAGQETICAAIFPRVTIPEGRSECAYKVTSHGFYGPIFTGDYMRDPEQYDYKSGVSLFAGNVAELDLRED